MNPWLRTADSSAVTEHLASYHYFDRRLGVAGVKVLPGEYFVSDEEIAIVTVLGSCVSACVRDRDQHIGGMNHFMLPESNRGEGASSSARYGGFAMEVLINHLLKLGARRAALEAKVFGGGAVMESLTESSVGDRNAAFVIDYLKTEGIPIVASDLLGVQARKLCFFPASGRVLMKKLDKVKDNTLAETEREYRKRLRQEPIAGDVELFG